MNNIPETVFANKESLIEVKQKAKLFSLAKNKLKVEMGVGEHASLFKTKGLDFDEVRVYQPGDDIRLIDWKITAKHNKPYTKLYVDEKEMQIFVVADMRSQMKFASTGVFKSVVVSKSASFLSFLSENKKDKLGFAVLGDEKIDCSYAQQAKESTLALIDILSEEGVPSLDKKESNVSLLQALLMIEKFIKKGSMVFILSDFSDFNDDVDVLIRRMARKSTCSLLHVYDALEKKFPKGIFSLTDGEVIEVFDTKRKSFQNKIEKTFLNRQELLLNLAQNERVGYLPLLTDDDYLYKLALYCKGGLI